MAAGADIVIVPTGTANMASVTAAFARLGARSRIAADGDEIASASHVMLPGVGAFGASMARLDAGGFTAPLRARLAADRPTIAICVGHQLLFEASEESPGVRGLAVVPGTVTRFPAEVRAPQFGWNEVRDAADDDDDSDGDDGDESGLGQVLGSGWAYFANSYRALAAPGWRVATAMHGPRFVAAMERSNLVGCQFHPELSHDYGTALLSRFLELGR